MIDDIKLIKENIIEFEIKDNQDLEKFISVFTILDKNVVAKTITNNEIKINYKHKGEVNKVRFTSDTGFNYQDIEQIIAHISYSKQEMNYDNVSKFLDTSSKQLVSTDRIFCKLSGKLTCSLTIEIYNNVCIHLASKEFMKFLDEDKRLQEEFQKNSHIYTYSLLKNGIKVISILSIHDTIESIVEILVELKGVEVSEKQNIKKQLTSLSFKALANSEVMVMDNISKYPSNHPLSKYKSFAIDSKNILLRLVTHSLDINWAKKLKSAINHEQEFSLIPPIITRSFEQLKKNFPHELNEIINKYNINQ